MVATSSLAALGLRQHFGFGHRLIQVDPEVLQAVIG